MNNTKKKKKRKMQKETNVHFGCALMYAKCINLKYYLTKKCICMCAACCHALYEYDLRTWIISNARLYIVMQEAFRYK